MLQSNQQEPHMKCLWYVNSIKKTHMLKRALKIQREI